MAPTEPVDDNERWSEVRQAYLPQFEAFLYRQRAGLPTEKALKWWERFVSSPETAEAIAAGRTIEEEISRREDTGPARAGQGIEDERPRREISAKADQDFLAGLSPMTAALVRQVTKVGLDAGTDYPCQVQVARAGDGRMTCTHWDFGEDGFVPETRTESDATFGEVLQFALESTVYMIDIGGLDANAVLQLLSAPEFWPTTSLLLSERSGEPLYLNGSAYRATADGLVYDESDD